MMKLISFIKASLLAGGMLFMLTATAQELFVLTEPASNMPSHSISGKITGKFSKHPTATNHMQRYTPEVMFGVSKKLMVHFASTFSDMYTTNMRWESARTYVKYRFFSNDEVHKHFRMAAFGEYAYGRNIGLYDDIGIQGDQSGYEGGLILTQLLNKLAVSSTLSYLQTLKNKKTDLEVFIPEKSFNYSLSAGYLVFPFNYKSFRQTNLNVYAELLGQRTLDQKKYVIDFAPALQLIFNSNAKLNIGYRFQLRGNMYRMAEKSWLISFERTFLGAWK
ncbi:MAG TPA: hypothetical protein VM101_03065 [Flavitalea sp.]|nr:hypothetical protein [Flavitalea sp.]